MRCLQIIAPVYMEIPVTSDKYVGLISDYGPLTNAKSLVVRIGLVDKQNRSMAIEVPNNPGMEATLKHALEVKALVTVQFFGKATRASIGNTYLLDGSYKPVLGS